MNILYFASVDFYQKPNPSFHLMHSMITDLLESNNGYIEFYDSKNSEKKKERFFNIIKK